ncbi:8-oxo-dGTP pyrophosphatase MutT (NUDIX family) [Lactobacillus colini]|uniref:Bis(5'-nucleosyl)-tetraphosphatase [asymmetrical] n=1 Tax=Lactobacillus colini TaxID=1819254 RepID=A0ABS4MDH5_9LACO|nr:NUDIX domain-containing protein [Lactobacillus colini]MBP2057740.1 8-oxo-dGTP pyrophosphatase MutT (NUDIX family) [Lactobacillus colini]
MIHEYSAGGLIYRLKDNEVQLLIVQSNINGSWGFPKGHLEQGETNRQAARREVLEEVGLVPDFDFSFEKSITYTITRNREKTVKLFIAKSTPGQSVRLQDNEIKSAKWLSYKDAEQFLRYPELIKIFEDVIEYVYKRMKK